MDAMRRVQVAIVDVDAVRPHEVADPARERRIERRLAADGVLRDPLVVGAIPDVEGYVLLDGTNRRQALVSLGCKRALVQVIDYADHHAIQLRTWCHAAPGSLPELLSHAELIPGVDVESLPPLATADALLSGDTLAVLLDRRERFALVRTRQPGSLRVSSRADQLRHLVDIYEEGLSRVDCDPDGVEERAHGLWAHTGVLVAFPPFSRSQVVAIAVGGALIPAGITRHVILGGRALRVNVPLDLLSGSLDLEASDKQLREHLSALQPRLYTEPTILYDS